MANLCQNPLCHYYDSENRKRKGHYQTAKATSGYNKYFCTLRCQNQYLELFIERIVRFIGLKETPSTRPFNSPNFWQLRRNYHDSTGCWLEDQEIYNQINNN